MATPRVSYSLGRGFVPPRRHQTFLVLQHFVECQRGLSFEIMTDRAETPLVSRHISALVFVNPAAGRRPARAYLSRMRNLFESLEVSAQFVETATAPELESVARQALAKQHRGLLPRGD